ncbi:MULTISPECIES: hypothetical protein [unclassified Clostridium]|uniref:hypothetical protein n=1 Tax=unclassified Clostridium TaxID=2614128 RepID=UPI00061E2DE3|nr:MULTISPECIES: hypothetical protein [unclassified Clostridium]KJZ92194.1 hypothetical protein ClosIBUN22A_CONTIG175g03603 [Clostridium sp. IBUN22A]KJZ94197.1 hypothetical protein ClosIBUN13A_CONTIG190g03096 [Clostridium sp. IBUN13A]
MAEYIKTSISRIKLYERNYTRDSIEKIEDECREVTYVDKYKALIEILTEKYIDKCNV